MSDQLSDDQLKRIEATLKRIRSGLTKTKANPFNEPAHIFKPEAQNDVKN